MFERKKGLESPRALIVLSLALVCCITVGHFVTDIHAVEFHNVYRRLYYLPIVLGCFAFGFRGGIGVALITTVGYLPHAFFASHHDPAPTIDKVLEIVLYFVVGFLTGWLVDRERATSRKLERALEDRTSIETQLIRAGKLSAMGEMLAGVAHEIRNPLASIKGSAEALSSEFDEDHRKYRMSQVLLKEIDRLARVVSNFLIFARPNEPKRIPIELESLVRHVVEVVSSTSSSPMTMEGSAVTIDGDRDQIEQVLLNLILNAIRATKSVVNPSVHVTWGERSFHGATFPYLCVQDNGEGISPELAEQIFDPFFTTEGDGTGLGLSISNTIIEAHGGYIEMESNADGTTFWVVFGGHNDE